ncbi:uncharacterized protein LOC125779393 [Bactrocera dorsalis]|uniref:Uncharacterized protein LOC125779393 n=1 Tax=Bactrocera dorsalis TaxID=27457 RepID=A0ABM3K5E9_BACDO|nr:uncharacterized protein LOC125779393 [Bactrocera dorsalis]
MAEEMSANTEMEIPSIKRVRKMKTKWTAEETEQLIQEVESREGTWNFLSADYRDRNLREAQWHEVAETLNMPRAEVSAKWNSLRCSFRAAFNRRAQTKSGQGAGRTTTMNPLYNSLKFLEPTLNVEASTTSNLINDSSSTLTTPTILFESETVSGDIPPTPSTSRPNSRKRRFEKTNDRYIEVVQRALETLTSATKTDAWDDLGNFVASNGREWDQESPQLDREFKQDICELIFKYQQKFQDRRNYLQLQSYDCQQWSCCPNGRKHSSSESIRRCTRRGKQRKRKTSTPLEGPSGEGPGFAWNIQLAPRSEEKKRLARCC